MGHKIFISYKYADSNVQRLSRTPYNELTTVRDYVDELQSLLKEEDQINKGELDGEDLSQFKDSTIESKLRNKIFDSSVTVVLISPNMKDFWKSEEDQWIPWEISYSLRQTTRNDRQKRRNGVLAVVLPDVYGSYEYMLELRNCCLGGCLFWHTDKLFEILRINMFNKLDKNLYSINCNKGENVYRGYPSYIHMIKWEDFINNISYWIEETEKIRDIADYYDVHVDTK